MWKTLGGFTAQISRFQHILPRSTAQINCSGSDLPFFRKPYSARKTTPRDLPSDRSIESLIDRLPAPWQWPVAVVGTYGCRHHEALLHAEVMPSGLVRIAAGKTDAR
jgi:hypothetical protein